MEALDFVGWNSGFIGPDGQLQGVVSGAGIFAQDGDIFQGGADELNAAFGGLAEILDDLCQEFLLGLVGVVGAPAVVVGGEGDEGVGDFCFAGEFGFGHGGHTDQVGSPLAMQERLGACGEGGTFDAEVGAFFVNGQAGDPCGGLKEPASHDGAEGFGEFHVDGGVFVEGGRATEGFVDDLIHDDQVAGVNVFAQRACGAAGQDVGDAQEFHGEDVGAIGDGAGWIDVSEAMTLKDGDVKAVPACQNDRGTGFAERRVREKRGTLFSAERFAQTGSADDADAYVGGCHAISC